jgi:hypothetical protein
MKSTGLRENGDIGIAPKNRRRLLSLLLAGYLRLGIVPIPLAFSDANCQYSMVLASAKA